MAALIMSALPLGAPAVAHPELIGTSPSGSNVMACQLFRDGYLWKATHDPRPAAAYAQPSLYARATLLGPGTSDRIDQFFVVGGNFTIPAALPPSGWPTSLDCGDNDPNATPAILACEKPLTPGGAMDSGTDVDFESLAMQRRSATIAVSGFVFNFMPSGRATLDHDVFYFALDGGKPETQIFTGETSRRIVQRFDRLSAGMHEIVYGAGKPSDGYAHNICFRI